MTERSSSANRAPRTSGRRPLLLGLTLAAAIAGVYWRVIEHEFIALDDPSFITANVHVTSGLSWSGLAWDFDNDHWSWHPLTWLSHQLDCQIFGLDPAGPHLENVVLHITNALLLFAVLRALTGSFWRSAVVSALFALHPLRVESVAWAAERKGLLSTLCGLLTIAAYVRYVRRPGRSSYLAVAFLFGLCLLSKAMLVTLPFVLLLLDFWPLRRHVGGASAEGLAAGRRRGAPRERAAAAMRPTPVSRLILEKVPLLLLVVGPAILATRADPEPIPLGQRAVNGLVSYSRYLEKMAWPFDLALPYPYPDAWSWLRIATAALTVAVLSAYAVSSFRRRPWVTVGWLWYLGTLIPVIGVIQSGTQSMADRFTYVPMIGILVAATWWVADRTCGRRHLRRGLALAFVGVLAACAVRSADQLSYWRNTRELFTHSTRVTRDNFRAHSVLGAAYLLEGDVERSRTHGMEALRIEPDRADVQLGMGNLMIVSKDYRRAVGFLERAVALGPDEPDAHLALGLALLEAGDAAAASEQYRIALDLAPDDPAVRYRVGLFRVSQGDPVAAVTEFAAVLRADPGHAEANRGMANALIQLERPAEAVPFFVRLLASQPDDLDAQRDLVMTLIGLRRMDAAVDRLSAVVGLHPDDVSFLLPLARVLAVYDDARIRDGARALVLARRACDLTGYRSAPAVDVLAAALAESGRFGEARAAAGQALQLAEASGDRQLAAEIRERAESYAKDRPHRQR